MSCKRKTVCLFHYTLLPCLATSGCRDNPCKNGGTCTEGPGSTISCSCPPGYHGDLCQYCERNTQTEATVWYLQSSQHNMLFIWIDLRRVKFSWHVVFHTWKLNSSRYIHKKKERKRERKQDFKRATINIHISIRAYLGLAKTRELGLVAKWHIQLICTHECYFISCCFPKYINCCTSTAVHQLSKIGSLSTGI